MPIRKIVFWSHLVAGLVAGVVIGVMSFTGAALAFDKDIVAWVDRAATRVDAPAPGAPRLTLEEMIQRAHTAQPGARVVSAVVKSDPRAAVSLTLDTGIVHVNPYTGDVRPQGAARTRAFMSTMVAWHRYLGTTGDHRPTGKLVTGVCNAAFLVLAVTGLYIWMPRRWSWQVLRPSLWFTAARGRARDWNWHNVIGLWSAPVLIVLTVTAFPISFVWVSNQINALNPPAPAASPVPAAPAAAGPRQAFGSLLGAAQAEVPDWKQITLRFDGGAGGRGGRGGAIPGTQAAPAPTAGPVIRPLTPPEVARTPTPGAQPVSFTIREHNAWPRTANTTLVLDPVSAQPVSRVGYAQMGLGQQIRAWTRFLHTGEALGAIGQAVAGLACIGGCFLVYTGFALSWRRFFGGRRPRRAEAAPAAEVVCEAEEPEPAGRR